ncbi:Hypothetical predicted protein [Paramuricea clavata]|uniref:Uncharacterized protein n=1 Tax=Paramuricea clavata TaxID=317549 RepID=A0A7D9EIQ7_PARCT|nr:Hypothetical predicted protein [Paramuricea clavata]
MALNWSQHGGLVKGIRRNSMYTGHDSSSTYLQKATFSFPGSSYEQQNKSQVHPFVCVGTGRGTEHNISDKSLCPAYGTICKVCGKQNHWKRVCRSKLTKKNPFRNKVNRLKSQDKLRNKKKQIDAIQNADSSGSPATPVVEQLYFYTLSINQMSKSNTQTLVQVQVNSSQGAKPLWCKVDTGAEVDTVGPTMLGLPTCTDLNLITLNYSITTQSKELQPLCPKPPSTRKSAAKENLIKHYGDCFEGIGCFQGEFHIILYPSIPPVVHPPHRVPEVLREPLKKELDSLVEQGIIAKAEQPTDWVNSLVCVMKSTGSQWLCLDPKDLYRAIKCHHHFTPSLADVLSKLNGTTCFFIIDARSGYWNIKLYQQSSRYTTFNSPYGRYRFLRLPFGRAYGFTHVTSSPQSNGHSERAVQTVKRLLQKCKDCNLDPHLAMLCLRNTPLSHDLPSPAELLNCKIYQTNLPAVSSPSCSAGGDSNVKLQHREDQQKILYDKSSKSLPTLPARRPVRFLILGLTSHGSLVLYKVASTPRLYVVETERGSFLRRNRKHLRPTGESFSGDNEIQLSDNIPSEVSDTSEDLQADDATNQMSTSEDLAVQSTANAVPAPELRRSSRRN